MKWVIYSLNEIRSIRSCCLILNIAWMAILERYLDICNSCIGGYLHLVLSLTLSRDDERHCAGSFTQGSNIRRICIKVVYEVVWKLDVASLLRLIWAGRHALKIVLLMKIWKPMWRCRKLILLLLRCEIELWSWRKLRRVCLRIRQ